MPPLIGKPGLDARVVGSLCIGRGNCSSVGREGDGQPAGRIDTTEQDRGDRLAAGDARIPGCQDRRDAIEPGHRDGPAGFQHDDRSRIGGSDGLDQRILVTRQGETLGVERLRSPLLREHDHEIRIARACAAAARSEPSA